MVPSFLVCFLRSYDKAFFSSFLTAFRFQIWKITCLKASRNFLWDEVPFLYYKYTIY